MVVKLEVVVQRLLQVSLAVETGLLKELADTAIEALDHAIGLGMTWRCQAVFDAHAGADFVEHMSAAGLLIFVRETVRELRAIVGQDLADFDGRSLFETAQEIDAAGVTHVMVNMQEDPARGAVDGHEQIAAGSLVGHLRQVLDVDVNKAWLVVLEGLLGLDRLAVRYGDDVLQARHTFAFEQARKARTRHVGIDVFPGDVK